MFFVFIFVGLLLLGSMVSFIIVFYIFNVENYIGIVKIFSILEMERVIDNFRLDNVIGEGGFGRVY